MAADVARMESPHAVESWNDIIDVLDNMDMRALLSRRRYKRSLIWRKRLGAFTGRRQHTRPNFAYRQICHNGARSDRERVTPDQVAGTLRRRALPQVAALAKMLASEARSQATNAFLRAVRPNMRRSQVVT